MPLTPKEQAQVELVQRMYQDFRLQMEQLQQSQNSIIQQITQRIDHTKTQTLLEQLKQS